MFIMNNAFLHWLKVHFLYYKYTKESVVGSVCKSKLYPNYNRHYLFIQCSTSVQCFCIAAAKAAGKKRPPASCFNSPFLAAPGLFVTVFPFFPFNVEVSVTINARSQEERLTTKNHNLHNKQQSLILLVIQLWFLPCTPVCVQDSKPHTELPVHSLPVKKVSGKRGSFH